MKVTFTPPDFNGLLNEVEKLGQKYENLKGKNIPFSEMYNNDFMQEYTDFSSFSELLEAGSLKAENLDDFRAISGDEFDQHIAKTTKFKNWDEMKQRANLEYIKNNT